MILKYMVVSNFRQFRGTQRIEFAHASGVDNHNVTVIFGENGRGKTSLFRAIIFCLFGDRRLSQDGDVHDDELQLVNTSVLEQNQGAPVEANVELSFTHNDISYCLKRSILVMRKGGLLKEECGDISLVKTLSDGNTEVVDPADVNFVIASILDKRVKDYFLFDGEKIERLTRADAEQRREIGKGIRNLLNVDALDMATKVLGKITTELETQLLKNASPELAKLLSRLLDNEDDTSKNKEDHERVIDEISKAHTEISKVDKNLESVKEISDQIKSRKNLQIKLQQDQGQAKDQLLAMKDQMVKAATLMLAPLVIRTFGSIDRQKQKGEIPSEIRRDLIDRILSEERCICGREICDGTSSHTCIIEWKNKTSDVSAQDSALDLWRQLSELKGRFSDDAHSIQNKLIVYGNIRNEIELSRTRIESINIEIGSTGREDATEFEEHRNTLIKKLIKLEAQSQLCQTNITNLLREQLQIVSLMEEQKRKQGIRDELSNRATLARDTHNALKDVCESFSREVKTLISKKATAVFRDLLDEEGRSNLRTVVVKDDYSLQVHDRWNNPFLANISAGQRQIMSISFITALAEAASKDGLLEMPIFMDTPFGRLSYEHRKNLIHKLPRITSQWILLATDTEFRKQEARILYNEDRWGKFYTLQTKDDGNSVIVEQDIQTAQTILKDDEQII